MAQFEGLKKDVEKLRELESKISKIDSYVQSRVAADESFNNLISRFQNQIRNNNPSAPGGVRLVPLSDFINRSNTWPPPGI